MSYSSIQINFSEADWKGGNIELNQGLPKFNHMASYCLKNKLLKTYIGESLLSFTICCPPITLAEQISISQFHDEILRCYAGFGMTNPRGMAMWNKINF